MAQEHVQVLEYLWGWRLHNHPRQSVTALNHHHVQKAFPDVQGNLRCFSLHPLLVPGHHWIVSDSISFASSLQVFIHTDEITPPTRPLVSRLNSPQHSQTGEMLQSLHKFSSPLVNSFQCACIGLVLGSPELDPVFQCGLPWVEEKDHSFGPLATLQMELGRLTAFFDLKGQHHPLLCLHS